MIKLLASTGEHVRTIMPAEAMAFIAAGLCDVGGTCKRVKYLRYRGPEMMPVAQSADRGGQCRLPSQARHRVRTRPLFNDCYKDAAVLPPTPEWLKRVGYKIFQPVVSPKATQPNASTIDQASEIEANAGWEDK